MDDNQSFGEQDIAIIGIGLRFPGAKNPEEFWTNLREGVESVQFYDDETLAEAGISKSQLKNPHYVKAGAPLDDMEYFDPEFFGFSPKEGGILDPQHRHFYECAWEALEDAAHPPENFDGAIGVFAGCGMGAYFAFNLITNPELVDSVGMFLLRHTGNDKDFLSSRVSYSFNLKGPSINVQTACSTSLVATHLACQSLLSGESDMALAGGSTIELPHRVGYLYKEGEILSPDGHCRSFDHQSKGTIFGSGTGLVVLRRLEDAVKDGDQIYAVIKGTAVNNDGSGKVGYLAPGVDGQAAAVTEALAVAEIDADSIDYIECHGTGTPVGDPIEVTALTQAFQETTDRTGYCGIGSVKTNIGHLDTAAGVASLIKASLAVKYGKIPPSLNYEAPNPTIDFANSPFYVNDTLKDWTSSSSPRRAGINALGVGGTNAFAIVEQPYEHPQSSAGERKQQLIVLSARNRKALDGQAERLAAHLRTHDEQPLEDIAYTLLVGRRQFEHRRVVACSSHEEAAQLLEDNNIQRVFTYATESDRASIVFMFPGGGAQYLGMGQDLYHNEPVFRQYVDQGFELLKARTSLDLHKLLYAGDKDDEALRKQLETPSVQLPAIFIIEYALVQLWRSIGITPDALIGHSMGENTAACVAGVISFEDALGLVRLRGELMDDVPEGGMLSVELSAKSLEKFLGDDLDLASINSPMLSVATGPTAALKKLAKKLDGLEIENQPVRINIAAHSRMLEGILQPFGDYLKNIKLNPPSIPFISNRTGTWITDQQATSPDYWVAHLRNTILFSDGIETLLEDGNRVLLEVGPGQTLSSLAKQNHNTVPHRTFSSLRHPKDKTPDDAFLVAILGRLWMCGVKLDPTMLWPQQQRYRLSLPTYAFQHNRYWIEPGTSSPSITPQYAQLEKIEDFDKWFYEPVWLQQGVLASVEANTITWLVFLDDGGIGEQLVDRLRLEGHDIVTVRTGDAYHKINPNEYRLPTEQGLEGYNVLVYDLVASGKTPARVLHLWLLTESESYRPGSSFFHRNQEHGFYSLFFLAKAFGDADVAVDGMHWIIVSNGMQQVADEALLYPEKATVLGPCKVIPREFPGLSCSSVDIVIPLVSTSNNTSRSSRTKNDKSTPEISSKLLDMLELELKTKPKTGVVAIRDDTRWTQRFQPAVPNAMMQENIRHQGVYLITGGLGGIGFVIGTYLAKQYNASLILINRTPLPERDGWSEWLKRHGEEDQISRGIRNVQTLEEAGAEVLALSGDVTNAERMRQIVDEAHEVFGTINGVFHTAGAVRDNLIQVKTQSEIEEVFTTKVYGTMVLDSLFEKAPLDFMLLCSSTSTIVAPMGQVDYVAANAFLNAYAQNKRSHENRHTVSVNWGVWNEVGMAADAAVKMGFGPALESPQLTEIETRHSLFEKRVVTIEQERRTHILTTHLSPKTHWLLDQHRTIDGQAILPGTAYIEIIRAALEECDETASFSIDDLFLIRALYVSDNNAKLIRVKLNETDAGYSFELQSQHVMKDGAIGWERHAQAQVLLSPLASVNGNDLSLIAGRCGVNIGDTTEALRTKQEDHLLFGPRWKVLRQSGYGENEAFAHLQLPDAFRDDLVEYKLHPALLDIGTGFAMELIKGYGESEEAANLWVPVSYQTINVYQALPQTVMSWVRGHGTNSIDSEIAQFDITIMDTSGAVLLEINALTIKKLTGKIDFKNNTLPAPNEIELETQGKDTGEMRQLSPAEQIFQNNLMHGILPEEGVQAIDRILSDVGKQQIIVSSLSLDELVDEANAISLSQTNQLSAKFSRPELDSDFVEARDEVERTLVGFWEELLGIDQVGVQDSFFDLGGHSLVAVRLFAKIKRTYEMEFPISVLFEAPTIEACAKLIRGDIDEAGAANEEAGSEAHSQAKSRYSYLVPMHQDSGGTSPPFFLVAGMFGNVLNLRHLAHLIGTDREFYGLQARGLYGDHAPHETFEEMARDYIRELKSVQPKGPYFLGGFSGGGITAFEMAKQLRAEGEEIALLVLLDTPLPHRSHLSLVDKIYIHGQRFRSKGISYISEWAKDRYQWEIHKNDHHNSEFNTETESFDFQSEGMEAAFYSALEAYQLEHESIELSLFRPKLDRAYSLSKGRATNPELRIIYHDNGWQPYVDKVHVYEVPGDHDAMVLEPNVRVLASKLREIIEKAESEVVKKGTLAD